MKRLIFLLLACFSLVATTSFAEKQDSSDQVSITKSIDHESQDAVIALSNFDSPFDHTHSVIINAETRKPAKTNLIEQGSKEDFKVGWQGKAGIYNDNTKHQFHSGRYEKSPKGALDS